MLTSDFSEKGDIVLKGCVETIDSFYLHIMYRIKPKRTKES